MIVAEQTNDVWEGIIVGDEGQVLVAMAGEVIDLEVVVGLGCLGERRGMRSVI